MRVFVTGAAGFIGQATVQELIKNGHQVLGLAHSVASTQVLTKAGAQPHNGDLKDLESLKSGAKAADGVIHLAFVHDFDNYDKGCAIDRAAIEAMGQVLAGTGKPLVIAAATLSLANGKGLSTEDTEEDRESVLFSRARSADLVYALSKEKQVRGTVVRLAPTVHGAGDKGMIPMMIAISRQRGTVSYVGDGSARWPAVHLQDAAVPLRLALEKGTAGATYHAVAEQGIAMKDIMTVVSTNLRLPIQSQRLEDAVASGRFPGQVSSMDNPTSSAKTQKELDWHPVGPELLPDLEANYFS